MTDWINEKDGESKRAPDVLIIIDEKETGPRHVPVGDIDDEDLDDDEEEFTPWTPFAITIRSGEKNG